MEVKKKRTIKRLTLAAISLFAALLLAETALRFASPTYKRLHDPPHKFFTGHPTRGYALKPGYKGDSVWKVPFRVNSLGFRGPEIETKKPAGTCRVIVIGDSIVMGTGLPEEALVTAKLEKLLQQEEPEAKAEVINAGVAGYNADGYALLLAEDALKLEPDAVVAVVCLNDAPGAFPSDFINPIRDLNMPGKSFLVERTAVGLTVQAMYSGLGAQKDSSLSKWLAAERHPPTAARIDRSKKRFETDVISMRDACASQKIRFILVAVPHAAQFSDERRRFLFQGWLSEFTRANGIAFIDLAPAFEGMDHLPYFLPDPVHPSPQGHQIMAEKILKELHPKTNMPPP